MADKIKMSERKIYVITMLEKLEQGDMDWDYDCGDTRTVGYYMDKSTAVGRVMGNACDIRECLYDYALVEEIEEGLYSPALSGSRWLFKYDQNSRDFKQIDEPEWMGKICGVAMG